MINLYDDSNKLTKLIEDLQQMYKDTKDHTQKLAILDKILKAYDIKQKVDATIQKHSLF